MAAALVLPMNDNPDIMELLEMLNQPGFEGEKKEYASVLDYVFTLTNQYNSIMAELADLKERVSGITDKKNPLAVMVEHLENLALGIGEKLNHLRESVISFTKDALNTVKEKGLSALGSVFRFLHVKDGLQAMSDGLAKSVEGLNKAVTRVDSLEQRNQEKAAVREAAKAAQTAEEQAEQSPSLSELLADTRVDFENLSPDELKATYEKLLAIGMNNDLTANELNCLQYLTDEAEALLPERSEADTAQEVELEQEQGEEI
jgi:hypothetical protein